MGVTPISGFRQSLEFALFRIGWYGNVGAEAGAECQSSLTGVSCQVVLPCFQIALLAALPADMQRKRLVSICVRSRCCRMNDPNLALMADAVAATFRSSPLKPDSAFQQLGDLLQRELAPALLSAPAPLDDGASAAREALLRLLTCSLATCSTHQEQPQVRASGSKCRST
jgi:hypothetical protein